jgi:HD-like signal output (HDOD) protein
MPAAAPSREAILRVAQKLPTTPAVLGKLQRMLANSDSDLQDICALLKRDLALSVRILRISNSPFYGSASPRTSMEDAVGCVGYNEIYKVVGLTVASQIVSADLHYYGYKADRLWDNFLCSALAMESIAQYVGLNPRSSYTIGLMRSIGKIVLDRLASEERPTPKPFLPGTEPLIEWEIRNFGCDNAAIAAVLLKGWNFSGETGAAVRQHYRPESEPMGGISAFALNIAGRITQDLGYGLEGEEPCWEGFEAKLEHAKLNEVEYKMCVEETKTALDNVRQIVFGAPAIAKAG